MAISHKTTIAFSLVSVSISLYDAPQDNDISFNQLHEADGQRIRYNVNFFSLYCNCKLLLY